MLSLCFNIMRLICGSTDQDPLSHNKCTTWRSLVKFAAARHGSKANGILKMEDLVSSGTGLGVVAMIKFLSMTGIESQSSIPQPVTLLTQPKNGVDKTTHILKLI